MGSNCDLFEFRRDAYVRAEKLRMYFEGALGMEVVYCANSFSGVFFLDTGTVENTIKFEGYRVSVGFGIRLYIPQLGPAPLAFDFGFPMLKQEEDQTQLFSFSMALPF